MLTHESMNQMGDAGLLTQEFLIVKHKPCSHILDGDGFMGDSFCTSYCANFLFCLHASLNTILIAAMAASYTILIGGLWSL